MDVAFPQAPLLLVSAGLSAHTGDHGAVLSFQLQETLEEDGSNYPLPSLSTIVLRGTELPEAPTKERRVPRVIGGSATIDGTDASLITYAIASADTAHAGHFAITLIATFHTGEVITWPSGDGLTMEIV